MKVPKFSGLLLIVLASFSLTGCFEVNREFKNIRNHLLSGIHDAYEKDQEFALGGVSFSMARHFMKDSDEKNKEFVENISELQIGTYKRKDAGNDLNLEQFTSLCKVIERGGWIKIVKSYDKNDISAIFLKLKENQEIGRMFIISMDLNELRLIEIKGKAESMFGIAFREKGGKFSTP